MKLRIEDQYKPAYDAWKAAPGPDTAASFLRATKPLLDTTIKSLGDTSPNTRSRARQIMLDALPSYDPSKSTLSTFAYHHMQGLKRYSQQMQQPLYMPDRAMLQLRKLRQAEQEIQAEHDREPSMAELADYTGLPMKRISQLRGLPMPAAAGQLRSEEGDVYEPAVAQPTSNAWAEIVYESLDPSNQKVMEWTLGLHGQPRMPVQEIARRMRLSAGAISQRRAMIEARMQEDQRLSPFF